MNRWKRVTGVALSVAVAMSLTIGAVVPASQAKTKKATIKTKKVSSFFFNP